MKTTKFVTGAVIAAIALGASQAQARDGFSDRAKVLSAKPIYSEVRVPVSYQECRNERVYHPQQASDSYTPAIVGGIIGGAVGNRFGKGNGRKALTIAGTLLGASIGNDVNNNRSRSGYYTNERRCSTIEEYEIEERLVGYRVKYRYKGQTFTTRMDHDPGDEIRLRVSLQPQH